MNEKPNQIVNDACRIVNTIINHLDEKECPHKIREILEEAFEKD